MLAVIVDLIIGFEDIKLVWIVIAIQLVVIIVVNLILFGFKQLITRLILIRVIPLSIIYIRVTIRVKNRIQVKNWRNVEVNLNGLGSVRATILGGDLLGSCLTRLAS